MAERSGVAKSTLSVIETGCGNPTVETIWAIANALDVPFGELVSAVHEKEPVSGGQLPDDGSVVHFIERSSSEPRIEIYSMTLRPGSRKESAPHPSGVKERVMVVSGTMLVGDSNSPSMVSAGHSHVFRADVPHVYGALEQEARAFVFVEYPKKADYPGKFVTLRKWPEDESGWDGVCSVLDRIMIDVANGVSAHMLRFHGCTSLLSAGMDLCKHVGRVLASRFRWPVMCFAGVDQGVPYVVVFAVRTTCAFSDTVFRVASSGFSLVQQCVSLAARAEQAGMELPPSMVQELMAHVRGPGLITGILARELLAMHGYMQLTPSMQGDTAKEDVSVSMTHDRSFSGRIPVSLHDGFESLQPGYGRQIVATAQDIKEFLPESRREKSRIPCIGVSTGSGVPLVMLHQLLPELVFEAIEPDETAFQYLKQNTMAVQDIKLRQIDFLEYTGEKESVPLVVCMGASRHLNTAFFFQKCRQQLERNGILVIADEFLPSFSMLEERQIALVRHHCAYILSVLDWFSALGGEDGEAAGVQVFRAFRENIPLVAYEAQCGLLHEAVERVRALHTFTRKYDLAGPPSHLSGAYARFFQRELEALVTGLDYEIERKTHPERLLELAGFAGFVLCRHRRVFATAGRGRYGGGTHVFCFRKISGE